MKSHIIWNPGYLRPPVTASRIRDSDPGRWASLADTVLNNLYYSVLELSLSICFGMSCSGFADRTDIRMEEPGPEAKK